MFSRGNLSDCMTDLTGGLVETSQVLPAGDETKEREQFRLLAEELDKKSMIVALSKGEGDCGGMKANRYYLVIGARKPSSGTFRKRVEDATTPSVRIVN